AAAPTSPSETPRLINIPDSRSSNGSNAGLRIFVFLLLVVAAAGAFFAGTRFKGTLPFGLSKPSEPPPPETPTTPPAESRLLVFENARRTVDQAPTEWLDKEVPKQLSQRQIGKALDATDADFVYLYGRALLLSGKSDEAVEAFGRAINLA